MIGTCGGTLNVYKRLKIVQRSVLKVMAFSPYRYPTTLYETCKVFSIRTHYLFYKL